MQKTKKIFFGLPFFLLICALAACLCACSGEANGTNGKDGATGKSAYEIWLDDGHTGSQSDFLEWLKGSDGSRGDDGSKGDRGDDGESAYEIWLDNGHTGTEADFLTWLKGSDGQIGANGQDGENGLSAYEIFLKYYPYYTGTEEQWIQGLANGELRIHTVTFKSEVADDIVMHVLDGYALTDIPEVPEKEGQTSATWSVTDFSSITQNIDVTAVYDMRKYVTFHNEFTDDEDTIVTVNFGEAITDIPQITAKVGNAGRWSITDFDEVKTDLFVEAIYETQNLQYTLINQQTQYSVSKGEMDAQTKELFIPSTYNGKAVTVIDIFAFNQISSSLTNAVIPNSVTCIGDNAFYYCSNLTSIEIPNSVTSIGKQAFYGCSSMKNITIGNSVMSIGEQAFYGCSKLTSVEIPNSVTSIGKQAFYGCSVLTDITIGNSVTSIGSSAFDDCGSLHYNNYDNAIYLGNTENPYYVLVKAKDTSINSCAIDSKTKIIYHSAFNGCSNLTSVTIPNDVTSVDSYAFYGCSGLTDISIGNSVASIGLRAFSYCSSLTSIMIPNSVTYIESCAFSYCSNLTNIEIPNEVTGILIGTFSYCSNLTSVTIPNSVTDIEGNAFSYCTSLPNIEIPNSVASIGERAFVGCSGLTSITIPSSVTSIGYSAFHGCSKLTSIEIPDSVTSIGNSAFRACKSLTSIVIPSSVTSIEGDTFYNCSSLASVVIPGSVTSIGNNAFEGCSGLTNVYYKGTQAEFNEISVGSNCVPFTSATKYFYSQDPPTESGDYWHYDTDEKTPVVW